jgi:hypothetical protein
MVILFEDKNTSGISGLIESAYSGDNYKLYFAGGNENILNTLVKAGEANVFEFG